jgi:FKBP-type peptidyl-prolyl cis-trans isomerase
VEAGAGAPPTASDGVTMKFALFSQTGTLLVSTEHINRKMSGAVAVLPGMQLGPRPPAFLQEAPLLMKPGSRYRFEVPPALCWGATPIGPLEANSTTIWELWLEKVNPIPAFALSAAEKRQKTESGLEYEILDEGKGEHPKASDTVEVHYTGWLTDGTLFDSSHGRGETISFSLRGVIPGWTEGVQLMRPGGKARFTIPGKLAYGPKGSPPTIGPNATLVFLIELKKIK